MRTTAPSTASWNTLRGYTAAGQRIAAEVLPDGRVAFDDRDRMIKGITIEPIPAGVTIRQFVMGSYDQGQYGGWVEDPDVRERLRRAAAAVPVRDRSDPS